MLVQKMVIFLLLKVSPATKELKIIKLILCKSLLSLLTGLDYLFPENLVITFPSDRDMYVN